MTKPPSGVHIIYHHPCMDGMAAALAAWLKFGDDAVYHPCMYNQPVPEIPDGSRVYLVDFSYKRPVLEALATRMEFVIVLDHHKTAAEDLAGLPDPDDAHETGTVKLFARFDMNRAGCEIARDYFHGNKHKSRMFDLIQDRDLWQWKLVGTAEFTAYLMIQPLTLTDYLHTLNGCANEDAFRGIIAVGQELLTAQKQNVEQICTCAFNSNLMTPAGSHIRTIMCNTPIYVSEVCHLLLDQNPDAPFATAYFQLSPTKWKVSLRSRDGSDVDVSAIAALFGGGGHMHAASFYTDKL